jgi:uncharacterized membrane protein YbhN (UPF0104 family)
VCLFFATRGTDWAAVGAVLRGASPGWSLGVILVSLGCHVLRAERWRVLLRRVGTVPRGPAIAATFIGFGANSVLPLRLGEIVRPVVLARRVGIPTAAAISSIVLERIFDVLLVICCFLVVGLVYDVPAALRSGAVGLGSGAGVGFVVLVLMARHRATSDAVIRRGLAVLPARIRDGLWSIADNLLHGLGGLAESGTIVRVLAYSIVLWCFITVTYLLSFLALDIRVPLIVASLTSVVVVSAFVFLPQAPGFIGTWQLGCTVALGLFGVAKDVAIGYSLLTWVIQMIVNVGAAAVSLALQHVSVRQLAEEVEKAEREAAHG